MRLIKALSKIAKTATNCSLIGAIILILAQNHAGRMLGYTAFFTGIITAFLTLVILLWLMGRNGGDDWRRGDDEPDEPSGGGPGGESIWKEFDRLRHQWEKSHQPSRSPSKPLTKV